MIFVAALVFSSAATAAPTWDVEGVTNQMGRVCEASTDTIELRFFGSNMATTVSFKGVNLHAPKGIHPSADLQFSNGAVVHSHFTALSEDGIVTSFPDSAPLLKAITTSTKVRYHDAKASVEFVIPDPKDLAEGLHDCLEHL
jgi:hypothetical protein